MSTLLCIANPWYNHHFNLTGEILNNMNHRQKQLLLIITALLLLTIPIAAHPHVIMKAEVELVVEDNQFSGAYIDWEFEASYSAGLVMDFDLDRDNLFSGNEIRDIYNGAFSNLIHYHYFTVFFYGDEEFPAQEVTDFTAYLKERLVHYRFFVPFERSLESGKTIDLSVFDETYYCAIDFRENNPITISGSGADKIQFYIVEDLEKEVSYPTNAGDGSIGIIYPHIIRIEL